MSDTSKTWPVIAVAGLERTGSMWTYNVARKLATAAGIPVVPAKVPVYSGPMFAAAARHLEKSPAGVCCIIKVHEKVNLVPGIKIINNRRNIADRLYSWLRFTKRPFSEERVRQFIIRNTAADQYYDSWPESRILIVDYERMTTDNLGQVTEIAGFMELASLGSSVFSAIANDLSKQNVKRMTDNIDKDAAAIRNPTIGTSFDPRTGFQSGHVSDYAPGDWRRLLPEDQVAIIERCLNDRPESGQEKPGRKPG